MTHTPYNHLRLAATGPVLRVSSRGTTGLCTQAAQVCPMLAPPRLPGSEARLYYASTLPCSAVCADLPPKTQKESCHAQAGGRAAPPPPHSEPAPPRPAAACRE